MASYNQSKDKGSNFVSGATDTRTEEQKQISKLLGDYLSSQVGTGATPYTGQAVAPLTADEEAANVRVRALTTDPTTGIMSETQSALSQALSGQPSTQIDPTVSRDYYQKAIYEPQLRRLQEDTLPMLEETLIGPGTFAGTPREEVIRKAVRDFSTDQSAQEAALVYADEQARRDLAESARARALEAVAPSLSYRQQQYADAEALSRIGEVQRSLDQAQLDFDFQEFLRTQPEYAPAIQQALAFLGIQSQTAYSGSQDAGSSSYGGSILSTKKSSQ